MSENKLETNMIKRKSKIVFFSFLIPFLFMMLAFIVQEVHPFGSRTILTVDLYHQYAPFAAELRDKLLSGESLFFSWHIGLGTDFWATFANYAASPLNLIVLLFPQKYSPDAIALMVCIRAGLSGLFAAMLLSDMDKKRKDSLLLCFSSFYALCGWTLSYFWNIMWHDSVVLLPLVVLGLRLLIREKKPWLYCISLFLCLWSNFFSGYFICFFMVLFFPLCYLAVEKKPSFSSVWKALWRFFVFSGLAGGMAAVLLLPTWRALQHSSATGDRFPSENYLTQNAFDFFSRFFLGSNPNIRDGMANVYCGVIVLLFVPLFFLCKKIRFSEKIAHGALLIFLYFSFSDRFLNFIWHGFHFPNQIPYRQAFILSFLLIMMAYRVLRNLRSFTFKEIGFSIGAVLAYILMYEQIGSGTEGTMAILLTVGMIAVHSLVLHHICKGKSSKDTKKKILTTFFLLELLIASQITVALVAQNESFTGWDFYSKKDKEVTAFLNEKENELGGFIRAEVYPAYISNQTALYHMKGMSIFSSTANEEFIQFMKSLGFHNNGINGTRNFGLTPVTSTLFGIRYLIDVEGSSYMPEAFTLLEDTGNLTVRENPNALSLGYMVSRDVLEFTPPTQAKPFENTNLLLKAMGEEPVYAQRDIIVGTLQNVNENGGNAANGYTFSAKNEKEKESIQLIPTGFTDGEHVYLYVQSSKTVSVKTKYVSTVSEEGSEEEKEPDSHAFQEKSQDARTGQIIDLGKWSEDMEVELIWSSGGSGQISISCFTIEEAAYQAVVASLSASELSVISYDSSHVEGMIDVKEEGVLLLTMTKDNGWTLYVDGKEESLEVVADALLGVSLTEGVHNIRLEYMPDGFKEGLLISLSSLMIFLLSIFLSRLFRSTMWEDRKRKRMASQIEAAVINPAEDGIIFIEDDKEDNKEEVRHENGEYYGEN